MTGLDEIDKFKEYSGIISLNDSFEKQINLKDEIDKFKESTKSKILEKTEQKALTFEKRN